MQTFTVDEATQKLWSKLRLESQSDCAIWIGSGLSVDPFGTWEEAVERLCQACDVEPPKAGATSPQLIDKAEECKCKDEDEYHRILVEIYADEQTTRSRLAYNYLWSLDQPIYLTTNYDPILRSLSLRATVDHHIYPDLPPRSLGFDQKQVYYIHGLADRSRHREFVFSRSEFDEAYEDPGFVTPLLDGLFRDYDILFVGCSLSEPPLRRVFPKIDQIVESLEARADDFRRPKRIILLPVPKGDSQGEVAEKQSVKEDMLNSLNIDVIWYQPDQRDVQSELERIFEKLCDLNRSSRRDKVTTTGL